MKIFFFGDASPAYNGIFHAEMKRLVGGVTRCNCKLMVRSSCVFLPSVRGLMRDCNLRVVVGNDILRAPHARAGNSELLRT